MAACAPINCSDFMLDFCAAMGVDADRVSQIEIVAKPDTILEAKVTMEMTPAASEVVVRAWNGGRAKPLGTIPAGSRAAKEIEAMRDGDFPEPQWTTYACGHRGFAKSGGDFPNRCPTCYGPG